MSIRPFDEMDRMMESMRRSMFEGLDDVRRGGSSVNVTLDRDGDEYVVLADLPGFEKSEIDLRLDDGVLVLDATHEVAESGEHGAMSRSRRVHEFVRLPGEVDEDAVEATYRNGVLEVRLPALGEDDSTHHIDVA
jgi:HSP20 family protein